MTDERMPAQCAYSESYFDDRPEFRGTRAHLANKHPLGCGFCGIPISALSDYGYTDFTILEDDGEPEFVHACWACKPEEV